MTQSLEKNIDIGIQEQDRAAIAKSLSHLLADSYSLYLKTHNFHWNVTGPMFQTLHTMFEEHYNELALAVDEIAERIRALGHMAPGSYSQFQELSSIPEENGRPRAREMITQLVAGHEACAKVAKKVIAATENANDEATADLATSRAQLHEKTAWMLRALLED